MTAGTSFEFFELNSVESTDFSFSQLLKIVFKRIYRIYGRLFLFLVIFIFKTKKNIFTTNSIEFNSQKLDSQIISNKLTRSHSTKDLFILPN